MHNISFMYFYKHFAFFSHSYIQIAVVSKSLKLILNKAQLYIIIRIIAPLHKQ